MNFTSTISLLRFVASVIIAGRLVPAFAMHSSVRRRQACTNDNNSASTLEASHRHLPYRTDVAKNNMQATYRTFNASYGHVEQHADDDT
jgi:hypothetical protein